MSLFVSLYDTLNTLSFVSREETVLHPHPHPLPASSTPPRTPQRRHGGRRGVRHYDSPQQQSNTDTVEIRLSRKRLHILPLSPPPLPTMLIDLDPKTFWNDKTEAKSAPTTPYVSERSRDFERRTMALRKEKMDGSTPDFLLWHNEIAGRRHRASKSTQELGALSTPSPLPRNVGSPPLRDSSGLAEKKEIEGLGRIDTNTTLLIERKHDSKAAIEIETDNSDWQTDRWEAKTPTPTTAEFHNMLESQIEERDESSRVEEMAEAWCQGQIKAAIAKEKGHWEMELQNSAMASALMSARSQQQQHALTPVTRPMHFRQKSAPLLPVVPESDGLLTPGLEPSGGISATHSRVPSSQSILSARSPAELNEVLGLGITGPSIAEIRTLGLELRVKQRLLPAIALLASSSDNPKLDSSRARDHAHSALHFSQAHNLDTALQGRCAYYVGVAEYLHSQSVGGARRDSAADDSWSSESESDEMPALEYFHQACAARNVYAEGTWAEEWVEHFRGLRLAAKEKRAGERPKSDGSWKETVQRWLPSFSSKGTFSRPTARDGEEEAEAEGADEKIRSSPKAAGARRPRIWERMPSFSSKVTSPRPTTRDSEEKEAAAAGGGGGRILSFSVPDSPSPNKLFQHGSPPRSPSPTLPSPVTSPKSNHSRSSSIFSPPVGSPLGSSHSSTPSSPSPTTKSIYERRHSRRPSLLARVTGRERMPSELEQAEEGDSPYRGTFEEIPETDGGWSMKQNNASLPQVEDMV